MHLLNNRHSRRLKLITAALLLISCTAAARLQDLLPEDYFDPPMVELLHSLERGDERAAKAQLANGLTFNIVGRGKITPLFWMYGNQDLESAQLALKLGADPNFPNGYGTSPVAWFAKRHFTAEKWMKMLMEAGGDPNGKDANGDPLIVGANPDYLDILLAHGADINVKDHSGVSIVLRMANMEYFSDIYWLATEHGADLCLYDNTGTSVADVVKRFVENRSYYYNSINGGYRPRPAQILKTLLIQRGLFPPLTPDELEKRRQQGKAPLCQDTSGKKLSYEEWRKLPEEQERWGRYSDYD